MSLAALAHDSTSTDLASPALARSSIAKADFAIKSGAQVCKGKQKLENVGKGTGEKIDEFIATGK